MTLDERRQPPGIPADDVEAARVRQWRRRFVMIIGATLPLGVVAGLVGWHLAESDNPDHKSAPWWVLALALAVPAVVLLVTATISWRVQSRSTAGRRIMTSGTPSSTRQLGRDLKAGRPLSEEQRKLAQALVDRPWRKWWIIMQFPLAVLWIVLAVVGEAGWQRWLRIFLGVMYLVLPALMIRGRQLLLRRAAAQGVTPTRSGA